MQKGKRPCDCGHFFYRKKRKSLQIPRRKVEVFGNRVLRLFGIGGRLEKAV
jgi:hypothetical protein